MDSTTTAPALPARPTSHAPLTLSTALAIEPGIGRLLTDARRLSARGGNPWQHYEALKRQLGALVGWHARRDELASSEAYQLIHDMMVSVLMPRKRCRRHRRSASAAAHRARLCRGQLRKGQA